MKSRILVAFMLLSLPWIATAQSDDDLYFMPKKEKKAEKRADAAPAKRQQLNKSSVYAAPNSTVSVRDISGNTRNVDEYNRRYTARDNKFSMKNDTLYIEEKPYGERGEWVNGFEGSESDYEYAMRIVRFRNPRYAIPVSSPLYWDVVYGAYPSWEWNVYDDGMYAYVFPTYSNPVWWDWRWNWGFSGPRWGFSYSWGPSWYYSGWYSSYYYGGYWGPCYGPGYYPHYHHHHYYPSYGWDSGWVRSGHTDYRPSRYSGYSSSRRVSTVRTGSSYSTTRGEGYRNSSSRRGSGYSYSRVVKPGTTSSRGNYSSVRPINSGSSTRNPGAISGSTRPSRGNNSYVRPSSTVDRSGSTYNRPSSTRRSVEYTRSRDSYSPARSSQSRSSYSSGSSRSSYSRSGLSGGSSHTRNGGGSRSGGGSRR